jgi:hypothetical protein
MVTDRFGAPMPNSGFWLTGANHFDNRLARNQSYELAKTPRKGTKYMLWFPGDLPATSLHNASENACVIAKRTFLLSRLSANV